MAGQLYGAMSGAWLAAYQAPIVRSKTYAEIWSSLDSVVTGGTQTKLAGPIEVVGGTVSIDRANSVRRSASNVVILPGAASGAIEPPIPGLSGIYSPFGNELRLFKGCVEPGGATEYAQLGHFLIGEVDVKDDATGITLVGTMNDNSEWFSRMVLTAPFVLPSDMGFLGPCTPSLAIYTLLIQAINSYFPPVDFLPLESAFDVSLTYAIPTQTFADGDDMWKACQDIAAAAGLQLYFDYAGTLNLQMVPAPESISSCVSYLEKTTTAYTTAARLITNTSVPNVVCVISQGSGVNPPIRVYWWDSNAFNPTYFAPPPSGAFSTPVTVLPSADPAAKYPPLMQQFTTNLANDPAQAQLIANAIGFTSIGSLEQPTFTIRDQPAHDIDDVVTVSRIDAGITTPTPFIVDKVQIDLGVKTPLSLTTRLVLPAGVWQLF